MKNLNIFVGLGSNLDNPKRHVLEAIEEIKATKCCDFIKCSSLYQSAPMGPQNQPEYINAVIKFSCRLPAIELLDEIQYIEQKHHRIRQEKWGPRTLDLDLLLYGHQVIDIKRLKVPHPGLYQREFVLYPLVEIEPEFIFPNGVAIQEQIVKLGKQNIVKLI